MKSNAEYWNERIEKERKKDDLDDIEIEKKLNRVYKKSFRNIEKEITLLFQRYAKDNELTYSEAIEYLTSKEFYEWRMDLADYIREIEETADPRLLLELNTLAMKSRISRLEELTYQVNKQLNSCFFYANDITKTLLEKSVSASYKDTARLVNQLYSKNISTTSAKAQINKVLEKPWSGTNYSGKIWRNRDKLATVAQDEITVGLQNGKSSKNIVKAISERMEGSQKDMMRLVRTERRYVQNEARAIALKKAGFDKYKYKAVGTDNRTCARCKAKNGEVFEIDKREVGENYPPLHPNCRCTVIPVVD